ncbi:hypothetical protein [Neisseria bacilliformis]|jgi:hypothetical protein|uniref:hypothetical protein n=1 Tax=Neisseria bacilliformis TaxID=267212 RepID=UPI0028E1C1D2|nr:hypothetical protein [Neisseria bacilliformis]
MQTKKPVSLVAFRLFPFAAACAEVMPDGKQGAFAKVLMPAKGYNPPFAKPRRKRLRRFPMSARMVFNRNRPRQYSFRA